MSKCCNKSKVELPKTCVCSTEKKETPPAPDILDPNVEAEASEVRNEDDKEK
ncbi:hypothetical protein NON08_01885 [Cetobacterium somerae]|uniref:hypothetical protein n=1 Tax=Cetobacterium sp. NK01 TaxID=2993530 RepID=UPI00211623EC|nr:hypothetical protein [Cetobacterium sp. NK01]MCQ8211320.1 hypothetical protein [Cetobacterium sp. NK01]